MISLTAASPVAGNVRRAGGELGKQATFWASERSSRQPLATSLEGKINGGATGGTELVEDRGSGCYHDDAAAPPAI